MRKLNRPLLRRLARKLRRLRHEEHYDQSLWMTKTGCGTAACVAGHAVIEAGWRIVQDPTGLNGSVLDHCQKRNGRIEYIGSAAARLLGLPEAKHHEDEFGLDLFSGCPEYDWPQPFGERWLNKAVSGERPSRIAADLLDAIADGKVEP